ncbi:MAG: SGNH/GDSL hydrolase family protein [Candidatus Binatus sp.]
MGSAPQNTNPPSANTQPPVMLVLGDSVMWGQGLEDSNKFYRLVFEQLSRNYPGLQPAMRAHSGAVIGAGVNSTWPTLPGEIPAAGPTIFDQVNQYAEPSPVRVILMNGGINDVDVRVILNPTTQPAKLSALIEQFCYTDMKLLLQAVTAKFSDPECRIILLGYYPILSENSEEHGLPFLLRARGIPNADLLLRTAVSDPRDLALQFWRESDQWLKASAAEANQTPAANNRIAYILPPFQEQNALFESDPWLWSIGMDLAAEDEVVDQRTEACIRLVPGWLDCQVCRRASVGHPDPTGAIQYYEAIMSAFS